MDQWTAPGTGPGSTVPDISLPRIGLWVALLLAVALGLRQIFGTSLSIDEAYSLDTAGRTLAGTLHQAIHFELQPPLYFLTLNLWLRIHGGPEFARLLSLGFTFAALILLYRTGRRLGGDLLPALLPLLAALTAPVAWSAMTARGYALTLLLLVACLHAFVGLWASDRPPTRWDLPVFIGTGIAATYTFYYSGFALAGLVSGALVSGRRRRALLVAVVCMGVALLPALPTVLMQLTAHPAVPERSSAPGRPAMSPLTLLLGPLFWAGLLRRALGQFALVGTLGIIAFARTRGHGPKWTRDETVWLLAAAVPVAILGTLQLGEFSLVLARHRVVATMPLLFFLVVVVDRIPDSRWRRASALLTVLAFGLFLVSFQRNQAGFDWRAAARLIATRAEASEPVIVFPSDGVLPLRWELRGRNPLVAMPSAPDLEHYDPAERYLRDSMTARQRVESAAGPEQSFWLLRRQWLPPAAGDSILSQYLARETIELGAWTVDGIDLFRLRRRNH